MDAYERLWLLGEGGQGKVFEVRHRQRGKNYAMKVISCASTDEVNGALQEIKVLMELRHPNIVSYIDFFLDVPDANSSGTAKGVMFQTPRAMAIHVCLVIELCNPRDLQQRIKDATQSFMLTGVNPHSEAVVRRWIGQCANALRYIHAKGFVHRDLKPTNVFFSLDDTLRLGDFGLAASSSVAGRLSTVGTPCYFAPELLLQQRYTSKIDVWGLGVLFLELLTLRSRPVNSEMLVDPSAASASIVRDVCGMGYSQDLAELIRDTLQRSPHDRPTTEEICRRCGGVDDVQAEQPINTKLQGVESDSGGPDHVGATGVAATRSVVSAATNETQPSWLASKCVTGESASTNAPSPRTASFRDIRAGERSRVPFSQPTQRSSQLTGKESKDGIASRDVQLSASHSCAVITGRLEPSTAASIPQPPMTTDSPFSRRQSVRLDEVKQQPPLVPVARSLPPSLPAAAPAAFPIRGATTTAALVEAFEPHSPVTPTTPVIANGASQMCVPSRRTATRPSEYGDGVRPPLPPVRSESTRGAAAPAARILGAATSESSAQPTSVATPPPPITVRVPEDFATIALAVAASLPFGSRVIVRGGTIYTDPLVLDYPVHLVGQDPAPQITVTPSASLRAAVVLLAPKQHADDDASTSGSMHNFVISFNDPSPPIASTAGRCSAVHIRGGSWRLSRCDLSCRSGCCVGVAGRGSSPTVEHCNIHDAGQAGVVICDGASGTYSHNTVSKCTAAGFLLKRGADPLLVQNVIYECRESGCFVHESRGTIEANTIERNGGCAVVVKGQGSNTHIQGNIVQHNSQAAFFFCDQGGGSVVGNTARDNGKAAVLVKSNGNPTVTGNRFLNGREAGVYVFDNGLGQFEDNEISGNANAGVLVTTGGNPTFTRNRITLNACEGVWVCKGGRGRFLRNTFVRNTKGEKCIDSTCVVEWIAAASSDA